VYSFDPPVDKFRELYGTWSRARYGLLITGQVQVDIRFLSIPGDVVVDRESLKPPILAKWKEWASIAQANGTPCIVQLAHPGRMSPKGAGLRPLAMEPICASSVPVSIGNTWLDKKATVAMLGIPREATHEDIEEVVEAFVSMQNPALRPSDHYRLSVRKWLMKQGSRASRFMQR